MIKIIIPALVSPKETVVGHGKSYLFRQIVTGRVAFTTLTHLLHWAFVILRVPFIHVEPLLPLHKGIGNFLFNCDAYQERTQQVRDAGPWSVKIRDQPSPWKVIVLSLLKQMTAAAHPNCQFIFPHSTVHSKPYSWDPPSPQPAHLHETRALS